MLRRLYVHGGLQNCLHDCRDDEGRKLAQPFSFEAHSPCELVQALAAQNATFSDAILRGSFHLVAGPLRSSKPLSAMAIHQKCAARTYHLYPSVTGANKGRGKMVLGLTLLGLSFVPGVSAGAGSFASSLTGSAQFGQSFAGISRQLLSRTGQYLMAQGAIQSISPQAEQTLGTSQSYLSATAQVQSEGLTIPLIYGEVRLHQPLFIETGLHIETVSLR